MTPGVLSVREPGIPASSEGDKELSRSEGDRE